MARSHGRQQKKNKKNNGSNAGRETNRTWPGFCKKIKKIWQGFCTILNIVKGPAVWALFVTAVAFIVVKFPVEAIVTSTQRPHEVTIILALDQQAFPCANTVLSPDYPSSMVRSGDTVSYFYVYVVQPGETIADIARRFQKPNSEIVIVFVNHQASPCANSGLSTPTPTGASP